MKITRSEPLYAFHPDCSPGYSGKDAWPNMSASVFQHDSTLTNGIIGLAEAGLSSKFQAMSVYLHDQTHHLMGRNPIETLKPFGSAGIANPRKVVI